mgnify:FL=1
MNEENKRPVDFYKHIPYGTVPQWSDEDILMEEVEDIIYKNGTIKTEEV